MDEKRTGRIIKCVGGLYTVRTDDGSEIQCRARGAFRHKNTTVLVGDIACVSTENNASVISDIAERKNSLIRPPIANIDYVFVSLAAQDPMPMLDMTDKLISILEYNNIEPVIIIGKSELAPKRAEEIREIYEKAGFNAFSVSCYEDTGIDNVREFINENLKEKIAAFAGASGVGKSTLLNKLFPDLSLATNTLSKKTARGRHTTREVTLFCEGDGYIADTPGFSMLDFERFDFFELDDLKDTFREFEPYIGKCKYTKCSHTKEEGCAIIEAVKENKISPTRHENYCMLYDILKSKPKWAKK